MLQNLNNDTRSSELSETSPVLQREGIAEGESGKDVTQKYSGNAMYMPMGRRGMMSKRRVTAPPAPALSPPSPPPGDRYDSRLTEEMKFLRAFCRRLDLPSVEEEWIHPEHYLSGVSTTPGASLLARAYQSLPEDPFSPRSIRLRLQRLISRYWASDARWPTLVAFLKTGPLEELFPAPLEDSALPYCDALSELARISAPA